MRFFQSLQTALQLVLASSVCVNAWNRLDKDNAALLIVDHQVGLANLVRDYDANTFYNNMLAHAAIGTTFNLPTVITTSTDTGPNGPVFQEIRDMHPNATLIRREGEVNAWDSEAFRDAVRATGKKQVIIGGIVTEVCTAFLALSLADEGYEVYANTEASGTADIRLAEDANRRMEKAGVTLMGFFAIVGDLMRDWRNTPGTPEILPLMDKYNPLFRLVGRAYTAARENGTFEA